MDFELACALVEHFANVYMRLYLAGSVVVVVDVVVFFLFYDHHCCTHYMPATISLTEKHIHTHTHRGCFTQMTKIHCSTSRYFRIDFGHTNKFTWIITCFQAVVVILSTVCSSQLVGLFFGIHSVNILVSCNSSHENCNFIRFSVENYKQMRNEN